MADNNTALIEGRTGNWEVILGLEVHAGHGLTVANVGPVAAIPEVVELNIGHSIVARAVLVGMAAAVREMRAAIAGARRP